MGYRTALTVFHVAGRPELKPVIPIVSSYENHRSLAFLLPPQNVRVHILTVFLTYEYIFMMSAKLLITAYSVFLNSI